MPVPVMILRKKDLLEALGGISDETLARIASDPENVDIWPKPLKLRKQGDPVWLVADVETFLMERKKRGAE